MFLSVSGLKLCALMVIGFTGVGAGVGAGPVVGDGAWVGAGPVVGDGA